MKQISDLFSPKHKKSFTLGRDPRDVGGTEFPFDAIRGRAWEISCYFICCGWAFNLLDRCYSATTQQDRIIGEGRKPLPGIDHLESLFINSSLEKTEEYTQFLRRYYQDCDIWKTTGDDLDNAKDRLLDQLYKDTVARRYRKDRGTNLIAWAAIILGAATAIIEFSRQIVQNNNASKLTFDIIGYITGALGLFVLIFTQLTNKRVQMHGKAAAKLDELRTWTNSYIKEAQQKNTVSRHSLFHKPRSSDQIMHTIPIKDQLLQMNYKIMGTEGQNLFESISIYRTALGYEESPSLVQSDLNNFRSVSGKKRTKEPLELQDPSKRVPRPKAIPTNVDGLTYEAGWSSLIDLEDIARTYDCPIIIVSEIALPTESCYQIINENNAPDAESKEAEAPEQYQLERESRCIILYCSEINCYQPVVAPDSMTSFSVIKRQLMRLSLDPESSVSSELKGAVEMHRL